MSWRLYESEILSLCQVKAEEFRMLGYVDLTRDDVWNCVRSTHRGTTSLHEVVAAVLGMQIGKFMNFTTMNAFKGVFDADQAKKLF